MCGVVRKHMYQFRCRGDSEVSLKRRNALLCCQSQQGSSREHSSWHGDRSTDSAEKVAMKLKHLRPVSKRIEHNRVRTENGRSI